MIKLVIFDLDGTLLNTITDLAVSTNYALEQNGFPIHPIESYKYFVGNGINKLFERVLPEGFKTTNSILRIRETFLPYYDKHNTDHTVPYKGICDLLFALQEKGIMLAVASNKYQIATEKLINQLFPNISFVAVFGQREDIPVKPAPIIVYDILEIAQVSPFETLYVGDSGVDIQTAANANVQSVGVTWGFRPREELISFGATNIADSPNDILTLIQTSI